jgi:uncharacterized SAM-binding protein YcdF (DUF218 family)
LGRLLSRRILVLLLILILFPAGIYAFRLQVLRGIGNFLVIHDPLEPADVIYLLNGDPTVRPQHAAALFRKGLAPQVVIARAYDSPGVIAGAYPNVTDTNIAILRELGVPDSQIVELRTPEGVQHTFDEAVALRDYVREHGVHSIIIVTSDLHTRRARFIHQKVLARTSARIFMAPVPDRKYGADNWWQLEDGLVGCQNEYLKLFYYHWKYRAVS